MSLPRHRGATERCKRERPALLRAGDSVVACHAMEEGRDAEIARLSLSGTHAVGGR
jgi:hypothetical protein